MTKTIEKTEAYTISENSYKNYKTDPNDHADDLRRAVLDKYLGRRIEYDRGYFPLWANPYYKKWFSKKLKDIFDKGWEKGHEEGFNDGRNAMSYTMRMRFIEFYDDIQRELKKIDDNLAAVKAA